MGEGAPERGGVIVKEKATADNVSTAEVESCSKRNLNSEGLDILDWDISRVTVDGIEWIFWIVEFFQDTIVDNQTRVNAPKFRHVDNF